MAVKICLYQIKEDTIIIINKTTRRDKVVVLKILNNKDSNMVAKDLKITKDTETIIIIRERIPSITKRIWVATTKLVNNKVNNNSNNKKKTNSQRQIKIPMISGIILVNYHLHF